MLSMRIPCSTGSRLSQARQEWFALNCRVQTSSKFRPPLFCCWLRVNVPLQSSYFLFSFLFCLFVFPSCLLRLKENVSTVVRAASLGAHKLPVTAPSAANTTATATAAAARWGSDWDLCVVCCADELDFHICLIFSCSSCRWRDAKLC